MPAYLPNKERSSLFGKNFVDVKRLVVRNKLAPFHKTKKEEVRARREKEERKKE